MTDIVTPEKRSRMMANIRGSNTRPEIMVRRALYSEGFRFRLHRSDLPGKPDIVLPKWRVVIFVHGCFWHHHAGCRYAKLPSSNTDFWWRKLDGNIRRDRESVDALKSAGWRVLIVWECAIRDKQVLIDLPKLLSSWIKSASSFGEISGGGIQ